MLKKDNYIIDKNCQEIYESHFYDTCKDKCDSWNCLKDCLGSLY